MGSMTRDSSGRSTHRWRRVLALYKERHLVELFINKIKHFRRIATRYDKTIASYASFVAIAGFLVWMR
jgi:transposase